MPLIKLIAVISIPVMMITDYYLTLLGKRSRDSVYFQHIASEEYELNPAWQKDINRFRLFNYKHILTVILVTGYFYFAALLIRQSWFDILFGALFNLYAYIIMRHLNNIFIFRYVNKNPDLMSGKTTVAHLFNLKMSQYQSFTTALVLLLIFGWTQSWFLLGGGCGLLLFSLTQLRWIRLYKKKRMTINKPLA